MSVRIAGWRIIPLAAFLYGLVGPFVGGLAALAFGCAVDRCVDAEGSFIGVLPPVFLLAYMIGLLPAALTGAAVAYQAPRAASRAMLLVRAVITGGVIAGLCFAVRHVMETSLSSLLFGGYAAVLLTAAIGAIASLACTGLALWGRVLKPGPAPARSEPA